MPAAATLFLVVLALFSTQVFSQRRRVGAQRALLGRLAVGDEVITSGGLIGLVVELRAGEASLEVAPGTVVRVALAAVIGRPTPRPLADPTVADRFHSEDAD
jgi:preprotein translocase subunit YajC